MRRRVARLGRRRRTRPVSLHFRSDRSTERFREALLRPWALRLEAPTGCDRSLKDSVEHDDPPPVAPSVRSTTDCQADHRSAATSGSWKALPVSRTVRRSARYRVAPLHRNTRGCPEARRWLSPSAQLMVLLVSGRRRRSRPCRAPSPAVTRNRSKRDSPEVHRWTSMQAYPIARLHLRNVQPPAHRVAHTQLPECFESRHLQLDTPDCQREVPPRPAPDHVGSASWSWRFLSSRHLLT
jgi:hypothetical protein